MHPQLSSKRIVCKDFIEALDNCHSSRWARLTGGCNMHKDELNKCLRTESVARASRNRASAKERRIKVERAWKDFNEP